MLDVFVSEVITGGDKDVEFVCETLLPSDVNGAALNIVDPAGDYCDTDEILTVTILDLTLAILEGATIESDGFVYQIDAEFEVTNENNTVAPTEPLTGADPATPGTGVLNEDVELTYTTDATFAPGVDEAEFLADAYGHLACGTAFLATDVIPLVDNVNAAADVIIQLYAGDANNDQDITTTGDASPVTTNFGTGDISAVTEEININRDSGTTDAITDAIIDIFDLVHVGRNFGKNSAADGCASITNNP